MDLIFWYTVAVCLVCVFAVGVSAGERKGDASQNFAGLIMLIPIVGRVFRWW